MKKHEAADILLSKDNILIVTHKIPDGDTLGSAAALCSALRRAGKTAYMYPNPQITDKFIPYVGKFIAPESFEPAYTVAVDVAADDMLCIGFSSAVDLCIDHHPSNPEFGALNLIEPDMSSSGEIILEIIESMNTGLSPEEADLLYIALSTDTGCFRHGNTNSHSFNSAAKLYDSGADVYSINTSFFKKATRGRIKLESMINSGMELYRDGKIAIAKVTLKMLEDAGATEDDCDSLAELPSRVDTELLAVVIRELKDGSSKISLRSDEGIDSTLISARFGGGGHKMASGCTIMAAPEEAEKQLLAVIDEVWK